MRSYGVEVKVITGDNELVAEKVCSELKLPILGIMTGDQLAVISDEALAARARATTIFARFSPTQKTRVINALKTANTVVGYLGDGINDAPSLKAADVGISVDNAVDVARSAADIILTRKSLRVLIEGIIEGRKTFGNTMKYLMMGISSNFGNMFSLIFAAFYLPFLPMRPLQVLFNNTLYDISQLTIPSDQVDAEYLKKPKHWNMEFIRKFMVLFGSISSVFDVLTFFMLYGVFHLSARAFQTGWFIESLATQTFVIYLIRTKRFFWRSSPSKYLLLTTLLIVILGVVLTYTPWGQYFSFQALPANILILIGGLVAIYLVIVEAAKHWFYKHHDL
jgi:Mg2+-importing ATPase